MRRNPIESDEDLSNLLVLNGTRRTWNTKQPHRSTEQRTSRRTTNSSDHPDDETRLRNLDPSPPIQHPRSSRHQEAPPDETKEEVEEFPYLSEVDEKHREYVQLIISLNMPIHKKLEELEDRILARTSRKLEAWLNEQENTTDFIKFLPGNLKELAIRWEAKKDIVGLDPLIEGKGNEKAQEAYKRWKIKHGLVQEVQQDQSDVRIQEERLPAEDPPKRIRRVKKDDKPQEPSRPRKPRPSRDKPNNGRRFKDGSGIPKKPKNPPVKEESDDYDTPPEATEEDRDVSEVTEELSVFPENMGKETTVVLLGNSGVGKTTFINFMANLCVHESLKDAREKPLVLINAEFNHINEDKTKIPIKFDANYSKEILVKTTEHFRTGESATQSAFSYTFKIGTDRIIRIVDTPGINDTRGTEQDAKNFAEIVNYLGHFKKIDAFIFMLKPNESRLDTIFKYSMNELLKQLHSSAAQNIIFCMSNGRSTYYRAGETHGVLEEYLKKEIYEKRNIRIETDGRIFVYDSEAFRYICAYNNAIPFTDREYNQIEGSWDQGKKELKKMLQHISSLTPHDVVNTLSVTKVRRVIERLAGPLAAISKNHTENMQIIEQQRRHLEQCMAAGEDLRGKLHAEEIHMDTEDLEHPITVCAHRDCVTLEQLHPYGAKEIVYRQECHKACYIAEIEIGQYPNENIKDCEIFSDEDENLCTECRHGYEHHLHLKYRLVRRVIQVTNQAVSNELQQNNNLIAEAEQFLAQRELQRQQYERDLEQKQNTCAHFAVFLRKNGILHYNDQYLVHLNKQINELQDQAEENPELLARLLTSRDQYAALVNIFDQTADVHGAKNVAEIEDLIRQLEASQDGHLLADIQALELQAADRTVIPDTAVVQVGDKKNWKGKLQDLRKKAANVFNKPFKSAGSKTKPVKPEKPKQKSQSTRHRNKPSSDHSKDYVSG